MNRSITINVGQRKNGGIDIDIFNAPELPLFIKMLRQLADILEKPEMQHMVQIYPHFDN